MVTYLSLFYKFSSRGTLVGRSRVHILASGFWLVADSRRAQFWDVRKCGRKLEIVGRTSERILE